MGEKNCDAALPLISLSSWWSSTYPDSKNILLTWEVKAWSAQIKRMSGSEFTITVHFIVTDRGDEPRLVFCSWHVAKLYCWGKKQWTCFHLVKLQYFSHVSVAKNNLKTKIPPPCWTFALEIELGTNHMQISIITCRSHAGHMSCYKQEHLVILVWLFTASVTFGSCLSGRRDEGSGLLVRFVFSFFWFTQTFVHKATMLWSGVGQRNRRSYVSGETFRLCSVTIL